MIDLDAPVLPPGATACRSPNRKCDLGLQRGPPRPPDRHRDPSSTAQRPPDPCAPVRAGVCARCPALFVHRQQLKPGVQIAHGQGALEDALSARLPWCIRPMAGLPRAGVGASSAYVPMAHPAMAALLRRARRSDTRARASLSEVDWATGCDTPACASTDRDRAVP